MKKIILIISLIGAAVFLILNKPNNTIKKELRDFAVKDTASISKIFFADKHGNNVLISKSNNGWTVNNKNKARKDAIATLLSTIYNIEVNYPVSNSLHNKIIKNLATKGVKIEIYTEKSTPLKTYYIGQPAANMIGSYMLLENSSKPFVMYIPGFNGFLAPRYNIDGSKVDEELWKDRIILDFNPKTIASVEIINHDQEELSYSISKDSSNNFILNYNNQQTELSDNFGIKYFELFNKISCEGFMNGFSKKDSILNSKPFHSIEIKSEQKNMSFKTFHKSPKRKEYLDGNGLSLKYDPDRFYALIDSDFTLIQFYVFNKLILDPNKIPVEK